MKKIATKHVILTYASTRLSRSLKAKYLECSITPYIPHPLCSFYCQRFGHSKTSCLGKTFCPHCGVIGHKSQDCEALFCSVNCHQEHSSFSKACKKWKIEKEIPSKHIIIWYHSCRCHLPFQRHEKDIGLPSRFHIFCGRLACS